MTLSISKVGYAVPFVIVMTTLIVGIATTDEAYILVQEGEVGPFFVAFILSVLSGEKTLGVISFDD